MSGNFEVCPVGTLQQQAEPVKKWYHNEARRLAAWHEAMAFEPKRNEAKRDKHRRTAAELRRLSAVEAERNALLADMEAIRDLTLLDAEGPELRAQNENNHRRAVQAIARVKGGGNG